MVLFRISLFFLVVSAFGLLFTFALPDNEIFSKWSVLLESRLSELLIAVTHIDSARKLYKPDSAVVIHKVDGENILEQVLEKMSDLWQRKREALRRLVNKAEESVIYYNRNYGSSMSTLDDIPFFNVKAPSSAVNLTFSPRFRQKVSFEKSGVHIPLEVYDGWMGPRYKEAWWHDPEMLNGLNWSTSLDEVFKENWKLDPTLRWQYFGSYFGFMRVYPSFRWPDHPSLPDLFDVRRRTWYIQGSISPKDVVILIDRSGSVHGQTLDIMKITVRALLNSLGENDYVNVAWFNNRVKWVVPCLDTLVQATAQIRRLLSDAVERLTESNLTSYTAALDFAFDAFRKFDEKKKPWAGSNCHKIIMFLSDGGTEWPSELVNKHCNESRNGQIRIFTFACGPHPIPTVVLKEMACNTGGYFSPITALGSVRIRVQDYVRVLSKPLASSEDNDLFQWHNFYRDIGGLGMMTTVTLPVFSRDSNSTNHNNLLGVMGIDVPIDEMTDLFPKHQLGLFGYPFAINTNGFVIFHPRLKDHIVYIEDPPDVDICDLEGFSEEINEMRINMIDGKKGSLEKYKSIIPVGMGHAIRVEMKYFYNSVASSTFRFGLALPRDHKIVKVKLSEIERIKAATTLSQMENTILAPWRFCPSGEADEELSVKELAQRVINNYTICNHDLVHHILWDVEKANNIQGKWKQNTLPGIWTRFLITSGGLTTIHTSGFMDDYLRQRDPLRNNLYKRAAHTSGCVLSVARGRSQEVTAACRIQLSDSYVTSGVEMEQIQFQNIFDEVTGTDETSINCQSADSLFCYLLNDGGIIIASNQNHVKAGDFIGLHDPEMLESLIIGGMLKREYRYNYLSWCSKENYHTATQSACQLKSSFSLIYYVLSIFNWNILYNFILYFISSFSIARSENKGISSDFENQSCVTRSTWYYHTGSRAYSGAFSCDSYSRNFQSIFLPNVTLILLIAQPPCQTQSLSPQSLDPQEDVGPFHCYMRDELYRIRPEKCYSETNKGGLEDCGADSDGNKVLSKWFLICIILNFFFIVE